ncbi:MAG: hypothetical protein HOK97_20545 [Deltaproteobacteria bacterium]|jgi:hypothetical protein|nr:hypothetical protein [Deltaproteobacteria bacterium]MBT6492174.1 hypothetical protein [Deltaproteobacteria bacterium]
MGRSKDFKDGNYSSKGHKVFKKWVDEQGGMTEAAQQLLVAGFPTEHNTQVGMESIMKSKNLTATKCAKANLDKGLGISSEDLAEYKKALHTVRKWVEGLYLGRATQKSLVRAVWMEQSLGILTADWFKSYKFNNL